MFSLSLTSDKSAKWINRALEKEIKNILPVDAGTEDWIRGSAFELQLLCSNIYSLIVEGRRMFSHGFMPENQFSGLFKSFERMLEMELHSDRYSDKVRHSLGNILTAVKKAKVPESSVESEGESVDYTPEVNTEWDDTPPIFLNQGFSRRGSPGMPVLAAIQRSD
jgi:hypothetical protein